MRSAAAAKHISLRTASRHMKAHHTHTRRNSSSTNAYSKCAGADCPACLMLSMQTSNCAMGVRGMALAYAGTSRQSAQSTLHIRRQMQCLRAIACRSCSLLRTASQCRSPVINACLLQLQRCSLMATVTARQLTKSCAVLLSERQRGTTAFNLLLAAARLQHLR